MTDYISREAVIDCIEKAYDPGYDLGYCVDNVMFKDMIKAIPAEEVKPIVHGFWKEEAYMREYDTRVTCTSCGETYGVGCWTVSRFRSEMKFCPNCGAEMDLKEGQQ